MAMSSKEWLCNGVPYRLSKDNTVVRRTQLGWYTCSGGTAQAALVSRVRQLEAHIKSGGIIDGAETPLEERVVSAETHIKELGCRVTELSSTVAEALGDIERLEHRTNGVWSGHNILEARMTNLAARVREIAKGGGERHSLDTKDQP